MEKKPQKQPWQLKAKDFSQKKIHAPQEWRFQMFFEYLRLSPSYQLAKESKNKAELIEKLGNKEKAERVWKTYSDIGNVYGILYRDWWLSHGLKLFGIETAKPKIESIIHLKHGRLKEEQHEMSVKSIDTYLTNHFESQGAPDALVVSIPLNQKKMAIMKQLMKLLDQAYKEPLFKPQASYVLTNNKMRYRRLLAGVRLVYMQAYKPKDALWRVATRAKISHSHSKLNPDDKSKNRELTDSKRALTFIASRMMHDTLVIAENAAEGLFPSAEKTYLKHFDFIKLQKLILNNNKWEKMKKEKLRIN